VNDIYDALHERVSVLYPVASRNEYATRCCYCGDSRDPSHAHLYINAKAPHPWHCKICDARGGAVGVVLLRDLGVYDLDSIEFASKNEKKYQTEFRAHKAKLRKGQAMTNVPPDCVIQDKLDYLSGRIGVELLESDVVRYRIITNFKEFISFNKLKKLNLNDQDINYLQDNYVGFLSADGSMIVFRDTTDKYQRYFDYEIYKSGDRTYRVETEIDLLQPRTKLVLAEGIISLLGAKYHCDKPSSGNVVYAACQGKGFGRAIQSLLRLGFFRQDVHIYADSDVSEKFFQKMKRWSPVGVNMNVMYNTIEDDFGHPADKIKIKRMIL
jgi:hypothetical protein